MLKFISNRYFYSLLFLGIMSNAFGSEKQEKVVLFYNKSGSPLTLVINDKKLQIPNNEFKGLKLTSKKDEFIKNLQINDSKHKKDSELVKFYNKKIAKDPAPVEIEITGKTKPVTFINETLHELGFVINHNIVFSLAPSEKKIRRRATIFAKEDLNSDNLQSEEANSKRESISHFKVIPLRELKKGTYIQTLTIHTSDYNEGRPISTRDYSEDSDLVEFLNLQIDQDKQIIFDNSLYDTFIAKPSNLK